MPHTTRLISSMSFFNEAVSNSDYMYFADSLSNNE